MTTAERVTLIKVALDVPRHVARLIVEAFEDPGELPEDTIRRIIDRLK